MSAKYHRAGAERMRGVPGGRPPGLKRYVAVVAAFLGRLGDRPGDRPPGLRRVDDLVDDTEVQGPLQAADGPLVLGRQRRLCLVSLSGSVAASVRRCRIRIAATAPITATSAPGQASTRVAPSDRAFIAM